MVLSGLGLLARLCVSRREDATGLLQNPCPYPFTLVLGVDSQAQVAAVLSRDCNVSRITVLREQAYA